MVLDAQNSKISINGCILIAPSELVSDPVVSKRHPIHHMTWLYFLTQINTFDVFVDASVNCRPTGHSSLSDKVRVPAGAFGHAPPIVPRDSERGAAPWVTTPCAAPRPVPAVSCDRAPFSTCPGTMASSEDDGAVDEKETNNRRRNRGAIATAWLTFYNIAMTAGYVVDYRGLITLVPFPSTSPTAAPSLCMRETTRCYYSTLPDGRVPPGPFTGHTSDPPRPKVNSKRVDL